MGAKASRATIMPSVYIRQWVSKKRKRYIQNGYDLDLSYITERLVAMSYPAVSMQAMYRNPMSQVRNFLKSRHGPHFKVYNLCSEANYDPANFEGRVEVLPVDDHHVPPLLLVKIFCESVFEWLGKDPENVAAIHCRAGKGRTGLMVCCFLVYMGMSPDEALRFYGEKRTTDCKGVTIASQRRYVHYWGQIIRVPASLPSYPQPIQLPDVIPRTLRRIRLYDALSTDAVDFRVTELTEVPGQLYWPPLETVRGECLALKKGCSNQVASMRYWLSKLPEEDEEEFPLKQVATKRSPKWIVQMDTERVTKSKRPFLDHYFSSPLPISGDVWITFYDKRGRRLFFTCFNTAFIVNGILSLNGSQVDKMGTNGKRLFGEHFSLELLFGTVQPPSPAFNSQLSGPDDDSFG